MKKHSSKKLLSIILSVAMIVTSVPFACVTSLAADSSTNGDSIQWQVEASTDFTKSQWGTTSVQSDFNCVIAPTTSDGGNQMAWTGQDWELSSVREVSSDYGAVFNNGYMYLSGYAAGYNESTGSYGTPMTGADAFRMDLAFSFVGDYSISRNGYWSSVFINITSGTDIFTFGSSNHKQWEDTFFCQEGSGLTHNQVTYDLNSQSTSLQVSTDNTNLSKNTEYHYVIEYVNGVLSSKITDADGNTVINYGAYYSSSFDTSKISGINIGSSYQYYYQNVAYKNIVIETGTLANKKTVDADKDKYVFTYFTGNSDESLHMAVSDDGINWEALNGNDAIWDSSKLPSTITSYPADSGIAASGHVRDPYAFMAEDGTYYVLATDLDTNGGTNWGNNSKLLVWHLNSMADLATTDPWFIDMESIVGSECQDGVDRAWAPEAIWDPEVGSYMLYWATGYEYGTSSGSNTHMYYVYTDDFKSFNTEPKKLLSDVTADNIDGDITFDGNLYYLWYKDEANSKIGYTVSAHANGPYSQFTSFTDSNYSSVFEGPEVYQLYDTGAYVLMTDHYSSSLSYFATYQGTTPISMENNNITMNLNYLSPRHGSVMNITTEEYNKLKETYGCITYDSTGVDEGENVNDYLVARYFTSNDATADTSGNGNTLTNNGVTMTYDYNGKTAAYFDGNSYAGLNVSDMFKDINIDDGVTFSWFAYTSSANDGRFFDWTTSNAKEIVWNGSDQSQVNNCYFYATSDIQFGVDNYNSQKILSSYKTTNYNNNGWHRMTMTISKNYMSLTIDGSLLSYVYAKNGESITTEGCPTYTSFINSYLFDALKTGNLYFGASSYAADVNLTGYISDFKVYDKALSYKDIIESINALENYTPETEVEDTTHRVFYDDMSSYTDNLVEDEVHGKVLNLTGTGIKANSNYSISSKSCDSTVPSSSGYTVSMWYNPGSTTEGGFFNLGGLSTSDTGKRDYFILMEDGRMWYCYSTSSADAYAYADIGADVFDGKLTANTWSHITVQVQPNGDYEYVYIYVNGTLTKKIDTFEYASSMPNVDGTVYEYFNQDNTVYYGATYSGWWGNSTGMISNVSIYDELYSAKSIYRFDCNEMAESMINIAFDDYKEAMAKLKTADYVYTNMYDAYEAYDRAQRYLESTKEYGHGSVEADSEKIILLYDELEDAIAVMTATQYKKPSTIQGYSVQDKNDIDEIFTHNMLTSPTGVYTVTEQDGGTSDNANSRISSSNFVWLYTGFDGDTPTAPYSSGDYVKGNTSQRILAMYISNDVPMAFGGAGITSSDDDYWHQDQSNPDSSGSTTNVDWYYYTYSSASSPKTYSMICQDDKERRGVSHKDTKWYNASGYARFTGSLATFQTDSAGDTVYTTSDGLNYSYITSFTPTFKSYKRYEATLDSGDKDMGTFASGTGTVQVINYQVVYQALVNSDRLDKLASITEYTPASCYELLSAYDALTSQSYILNSTTAATTLAQTLKKEVDDLESVDLTKLEQKAEASDLQSAVEAEQPFYEAAVVTQEDGTTLGKVVEYNEETGKYTETGDMYTASSWRAYSQAISAMDGYFTALDPFGEDEPYATSQSQLDGLKEHIADAKKYLVIQADYTPVETTAENYADIADTANADSSGAQIYSYGTWIDFDDNYEVAKSWADKSSSYKLDTEKYAVDYEVNATGGPYIAYDTDGNIVTSADQESNIDYYVFIGEFYDNEGDEDPSQFETGDWVKINGVFTQLNGHRYYTKSVSTTELSAKQTQINSAKTNTDNAKDALDEVADYSAYDATTELLKYQDVGAFSDEYLASDSSIYKTIAVQGTSSATVAYASGATTPVTCETPEYTTKNTAYVNVNGVIYKNVGQSAQTSFDNVTAGILTNLQQANLNETSNSVRRSYNVKFTVANTDDNTESTSTTSYYYGQDVPLSVSDDLVCYKWEVTANGVTSTIPATQSYTLHIQSNAEVKAYCSNSELAEDTIKIQIINQYGKVTQEFNVDPATEVSLGDNAYTIGSTTYALSSSPYYQFAGWHINGAFKSDGNGAIDISELADDDNVVAIEAQYHVVTDASYTVSGDGVTVTKTNGVSALRYDDVVTVPMATGAYGIAIKNTDGSYAIVSYDSDYDYTVVGDAAFYSVTKTSDGYSVNGTAITDSEMLRKLNSKLPFVYSIGQTGDKFTTYSGYSQGIFSTGTVVTEVGTLVTRDASVAADPEKFVLNGTGVTAVATKSVNASNQYYLRIKKSSSGTVYTRSYIKYRYTPSVEVGSVTTGTLIQSIDYGNICQG